MEKNDALSAWYKPCLGDEDRDIAKEAYQNAVVQLRAELAKAKVKVSLPVDTYSSIQEVEAIVNDAKQRYEQRRSNPTGARHWLEKLSYRIMHYSRIFDTIAAHHQEYVSLAWGAIKFVLMAIVNRAVLVQKLSEALVAIIDVLPRADLNAELYPTKYMESALTRLYVHVMLFSLECVRWYNRSSLGRMWSAIKDPFELNYRDLVEQIKHCSENIESLANAGLRAEARHSHDLIKQQEYRFEAKLVEMRKGFEANLENFMRQLLHQGTSNRTVLDRIDVNTQATNERTRRMEFHDILKFFEPKVSPDKALLKIQCLARRNPTWTLLTNHNPKVQKDLSNWVSNEKSSLLIVRVGPHAQKQAKELAADIVKYLNTNSQTVFWSLSLTYGADRPTDMATVFKSIIFQLLHRFRCALADFADQLTLSKIDSPHTDREWVDLICHLLSNIPDAFLVLETEELNRAYQDDPEWSARLLELLQTIADRISEGGSKLKILVIIYGGVIKVEASSPVNYSLVVTPLQASMPVPPRLRHVAQRSGLVTKGWKLQKAKI